MGVQAILYAKWEVEKLMSMDQPLHAEGAEYLNMQDAVTFHHLPVDEGPESVVVDPVAAAQFIEIIPESEHELWLDAVLRGESAEDEAKRLGITARAVTKRRANGMKRLVKLAHENGVVNDD